jgi:hypothetical protein
MGDEPDRRIIVFTTLESVWRNWWKPLTSFLRNSRFGRNSGRSTSGIQIKGLGAWRPPLWSNGQSSWLQIRRIGFDSRHYQIFRKKRKTVVGLERSPLSLVSTTEELLDRKVSAPVYKIENTVVGIRYADQVAPPIRKSWQSLRRQAAVARSV